jgi:hypothetical protein
MHLKMGRVEPEEEIHLKMVRVESEEEIHLKMEAFSCSGSSACIQKKDLHSILLLGTQT